MLTTVYINTYQSN